MVIVVGSVTVKAEHVDEVERLSVEHVRRSREEPGCLLHSVHRDVENHLRFVFLEYWTGSEALLVHIGVPASGRFVRAVTALASEDPSMVVYNAAEMIL